MSTVPHSIGKRRLATQVAESRRRYLAERGLQLRATACRPSAISPPPSP